jgi:hypothetical protein
VPWERRLEAVIESLYATFGRVDRQPFGVPRMLRMYKNAARLFSLFEPVNPVIPTQAHGFGSVAERFACLRASGTKEPRFESKRGAERTVTVIMLRAPTAGIRKVTHPARLRSHLNNELLRPCGRQSQTK